jgi:ABC-type nitrate/sulfonate/bicarbonate transport system substrate-binding protein
MKALRIAGLALALALPAAPCGAAEAVNLILNWTPTADHSPFYYAKSQGWYEKAGIDLTIEVGKGSGVSSLKVGSGGSPFGIADLLLAEELWRERTKGLSEPQDRQSAGRCLARDVAGLRQGRRHRA